MRRRGLSAERLALVKRYAEALWRDPPDLRFAPPWALRPWTTEDVPRLIVEVRPPS